MFGLFQLDRGDSDSASCDGDAPSKAGPSSPAAPQADGLDLDLGQIFFSNEEYYRKLEELKKAHLQTMADLESMYQQKLHLRPTQGPEAALLETGPRWGRFLVSRCVLQTSSIRLTVLMVSLVRPLSPGSRPAAGSALRRSQSAADLRRSSAQSGSSGRPGGADVEKGLLFSPKEYIKNMWRDFQVPPHARQLSSSLRSLPDVPKGQQAQREQHPPRPRTTVPKPFQMTLRESERRRRGIKSRAEVEMENRELRRQLEELTECQKKFRASPLPAHIYLPEYAELQEQRRRLQLLESQSLTTVPKPFRFLERERLKKEQRQQEQEQEQRPPSREKVPPFRAQPVPPAVYAAASGERQKEEQLHRSIKIHMRAQELLHSATTPPSMVARRLSQRQKGREGGGGVGGQDAFPHRPHINREVPDFEASYRCFQKQLRRRKQWKPSTSCQPFQLHTSQMASHRQRILAQLEREQSSPRELRWPFLSPGPPRTPTSSLCSSLSGSLELLPTKATGATRKRHEAIRYPSGLGFHGDADLSCCCDPSPPRPPPTSSADV